MADSPQQFDKIWSVGEIQLVGGQANIVNPNVNNKTICFLQRRTIASVGNLWFLVIPGTGITITTDGADGFVDFMLIQLP